MTDLPSGFSEKLAGIAAKWTTYSAIGSFILYLIGYLTLRFQLSTYGVATSLSLLDESYLFAGCRFLVYLVSAVPSVLIMILVISALVYLPWKLIPPTLKERLGNRLFGNPNLSSLIGVAFSIVFIQLVLRKCFALGGNLLLSKDLTHDWIGSVLLAGNAMQALYFDALLAGTMLSGALLYPALNPDVVRSPASRFWTVLLVFLFAVEFLLLPVNYGVLISSRQLPRLAESPTGDKLSPEQLQWLVWENKDTITYLTLDKQNERVLVTIDRSQAKIKIIAYDDIFCILFGRDHDNSASCQR
jgi:hypothetical protein